MPTETDAACGRESRAWMPSIHWAQFQQTAYYQGPERRLYDFEMMLVLAGEMAVHFKDEPETIRYYPGDLLFLHAGERHRIEIPLAGGAQLLGVHFDFHDEFELSADIHMVVDEARARDELFCIRPAGPDGERLFARKYAAVPDGVAQGLALICEEFTSARSGHDLVCRGAMLQILAAILREPALPRRSAHAAYAAGLRALIDELHGSLHLPWPNAAMAERLNVSEDHFIRLFKEQYGATPNQYVQRLRHQEAKRCLRDTDMKVEAIGMKLGYDSLHHFSHVFKRWQGVSPREYRKMCGIL
ncbi:helix-turn-helix transcriptional regulator [Paenibacillus lycopersici]|uniref:Helix-turn-helix transcriptional regulator n=1 Tax=Paenibacillus lycopersici TaxID=2704462 RepID=A0A6C0G4S5_9BACL|nr:AraC family transcriptional regulator [Paenibacillus lycopersici]QHT62444.1 helix-turn-helix transcriptional regulator [Paenibacillus lycopersici]